MTMTPQLRARLVALEAELTRRGLWGDQSDKPENRPGLRPGVHIDATGEMPVVRANPACTPGDLAAAEQVAAGWDWSDAAVLADHRAAAVELAGGGSDPLAIGTRSLAAFAATRDNDQAEAFAALLDLLGISPAALTDRIATRRLTTPATPGAPDPDGVVYSATTRLGRSTVLAAVAGYAAAGAGDPIEGGG